jgi:hypothetical protein
MIGGEGWDTQIIAGVESGREVETLREAEEGVGKG